MSRLSRLERSVRMAAFMAIASVTAVSATRSATGDEEAPPPYVPGQVIVSFTEDGLAEVEALAPRSPDFLRRHGITSLRRTIRELPARPTPIERSFGLHRLYTLQCAPEADVLRISEDLAREREIEFAHPNYLGEGGAVKVVPQDTSYSSQWHLDNTGQTGGTNDADMDAAEAWNVAVGRRETLIGVLDTGIDGDHTEFQERIARGGYDYVNTDADPEGDHSHGTNVTGIAAANTNNQFSVSGVNWRAQIMPIKVLGVNNTGTTTDLIEGIYHGANHGVDVANMSLIGYPNVAGLSSAVAFADQAGVIQIGCNGNAGTTTPSYPGSYSQVLATGWTDHSDVRSASSNHTTTLDVVAPGVNVRTVAYNTSSDTFSLFSGCSAATPNAAGVAAVLHGLDPTLTGAQARNIIQSTADDQVGPSSEDTPGRDDYFGYGRVNMQRALASLGLVSRNAVHVDEIRQKRVSSTRHEIRVAVVDDLTGAEDGVAVSGTLTLPNTSTVSLNGTAGSNGVATLVYEPGGPLPAGTFRFHVNTLSKSGFTYESSANFETDDAHDPNLNGVHVKAIDMTDDFTTLTVEVQVHDDDLRPEGAVTVQGTLTDADGTNQSFSGSTTWASAGVVRFTHAPASLKVGSYSFQVTSLSKSGFVYESGRNVETTDTHVVNDPLGDLDGDGVSNQTDNCRTRSNLQVDTDGDGIGDACDTCPGRVDPAQDDTDHDGTGDRCDCAPYDSSTADVSEALSLRIDADRVTLRWNGVAGADFYDVSRGAIGTLNGSDYGACLSNNLSATSVQDSSVPAPGTGYFYLVRGDDAICGAGTLGRKSNGQERVNSNPSRCAP